MDDEIFDCDRVIGECLITFNNFDMTINENQYCCCPLNENIAGDPIGFVNICGYINTDGFLEVIVYSIKDIIDKYGDEVKDDNSSIYDAIFFGCWLSYLFISAMIFSLVEEWNYFKALYYRIITLFTVGMNIYYSYTYCDFMFVPII